jgi:hypothetical protein
VQSIALMRGCNGDGEGGGRVGNKFVRAANPSDGLFSLFDVPEGHHIGCTIAGDFVRGGLRVGGTDPW